MVRFRRHAPNGCSQGRRQAGAWLGLLWLSALWLPGATPTVEFHHLTREQGLSHSYVNCMLQDDQGFLWFGTEDGLNRFDGYRCEVYRSQPGRGSGLSHVRITALHQDAAGTLWVGTNGGGLNRYHPRRNRFEAVAAPPAGKLGDGFSVIQCISSDDHGRLWLGTQGGLIVYNPAEKNWEPSTNTKNFNLLPVTTAVHALAWRNRRELWVGSAGNGLWLFDLAHQRARSADPALAGNTGIWALYSGEAGLLIGDDDGLWRLADRRLEPVVRGIGPVRDILGNPAGQLWLATDRGLWHRRTGAATMQAFHAAPQQAHGLSSERVRCLLRDHSGVVWIGTDDGLNHHAPDRRKFNAARKATYDQGINYRNVHLIYQDRGNNLWVGGQGMGLVCNQPELGRSRHFVADEDVRCLTEDAAGNRWVGTRRNGLLRLSSDARPGQTHPRYLAQPGRQDSLADNGVYALWVDGSQRLWVGSRGGLQRLLPAAGDQGRAHFEWIPLRGGRRAAHVYTLHAGRDDHLWIGTLGQGLFRLDPNQSGQDTAVSRFVQGGVQALSSNDVLCLAPAGDRGLWIGTGGGGLNLFNPDTQQFQHFTDAIGLASNTIYAILEDDSRRLWLSTNNGVTRFDPVSRRVRNFTAADGLLSNEFNGGAYLKTRDGTFYFGGKYGVNSFQPLWIQANQHPPKTVITQVGVAREGPLQRLTDFRDGLILDHRDRLIALDFAGLHFVNPARNLVEIKLDGLEEEWRQVGNHRSVTYANLKPGDYVFRVRAANSDRVWDKQGLALPIQVVPALWQTWWFQLVVLVLLVLIGSRLIRGRVNFLWAQRQALARLDALTARTRQGALIAHEVQNPIFTINNLLCVMQAKRDRSNADRDELFQLLQTEVARLRTIIKRQSDFTNAPLPAFQSADLRELLTTAIKVLKWGNRLGNTKIFIAAPAGSFPVTCNPESLQQVFMNVIRNAVLSMAGQGKLDITLERDNAGYQLHFIDNGPGFEQAAVDHLFQPFASSRDQDGTGLGLFICHSLIKKHQGTITLNTDYTGGAHLIIQLPKDGGRNHE